MLTNLFEASIATIILHVASARESLLKRSAAGEESRERAVRLLDAAAWVPVSVLAILLITFLVESVRVCGLG
jgi:hypothetical protein